MPSTEAPERRPPATLSRGVKLGLAGLVVLIIAAYARVLGCDFVLFDDHNHIFENPIVTNGFQFSDIKEAFTTCPAGLWAPFTWLSLALDVTLFGMNPAAMHGVNALIHLTSTLLLFRAVRLMVKDEVAALIVATLFGLHPLNVESIAWVTERKNALSALFWMPAMYSYVRYAQSGSVRAWWASLAWFACSLFSKPSATPFPFVLLLLDYWPFRRLESIRTLPRLILEKLPFFAASAFTSLMTIYGQSQANAIAKLDMVSMPVRIGYALENWVWYASKLFWPTSLAAFYPHPGSVDVLIAATAGVALVIISGLCLWLARRQPWWIVGWLWFVGTLVPTIGLVHVGSVARADRFTYLPQIGIWIALAVTAAPGFASSYARIFRIASVTIAILLAGLTSLQVGYWESSLALFERAVEITPERNSFSWRNAGLARLMAGDYPRAILYLRNSLRYRNSDPWGWIHLGDAYLKAGSFEDARISFENAAGIDQNLAIPLYDASLAAINLGRIDDAEKYLQAALHRKAAYPDAYIQLARVMAMRGDRNGATELLEKGLAACNNDSRLQSERNRFADSSQEPLPPEKRHPGNGVSSAAEVRNSQ